MCTSCAWGKPVKPHLFEFCENGAKATIWELTRDRCTPAFFAEHTVTELREWQDYDLEMHGRLTHPLRYDAATDKYVACAWDEAFSAIAQDLNSLDPRSAIFYPPGKAALEMSYLYSLFARFYGHNNLPDSSNMCHETTSVTLKKVIGSPVGTCVLDDFDQCDAIFYFGQNPGSNRPRFLHPLQDAVKRGCKIMTFNPVREKGLEHFVNPQNPIEMLTGPATALSHMYLQVRPGGDIAALMGLCKHGLAIDKQRPAQGAPGILDRAFIAELLKGNLGRPGTGMSPVRGHSNVQGQRTVGISVKPELVPLDKLAALFDFDPPRDTGRTTVDACQGILDGSVRAFIRPGGNFVRAIPEREAMEAAWSTRAADCVYCHQAQSQPPRSWPIRLHPAVPGTIRAGHAVRRCPNRDDRR